jgi:hypothetical protein
MSERHAHFFGSDPEMSSYDSNVKAIEARVGKSWRVICGHCNVTLCASVTDPPTPKVDIVWRNEGGYFGSFTVLQ